MHGLEGHIHMTLLVAYYTHDYQICTLHRELMDIIINYFMLHSPSYKKLNMHCASMGCHECSLEYPLQVLYVPCSIS